MKNSRQKLDLEHHLPTLALLAAAILGLYVRLNPVLQTDFPLNDGSLFVLMSQELVQGHFRLPEFTGYNLSQIPYAYPPLGFYLAASIARISSWDMLSIFRFLPALLSWLTIPAFFLAAKRLLKSTATLSIAVIIFALIPRSWLWLIMGGGLTRSLGLFFSILSIYFGHRLFTEHKGLLTTILCYTLAVLSHPEALIFAALGLVFLYLVYDRSLTGFRDLALVGGGALLLSAPWWLTVILRHGFNTFLAAGETSGFTMGFLEKLIVFDITGESSPAVFAVLSLVGVFSSLSKQKYFLPLLTGVTIIFLQRSGPNFLMFPIAILAAIGIGEVLLVATEKHQLQDQFSGPARQKLTTLSKIMLGFLLVNLLYSTLSVSGSPDSPLHAVQPEEAEVMAWIKENTPADGNFLVISDKFWWEDLHGEWFPVLAERHSVNTLQGAEWLPGEAFNQALTWRAAAEFCLDQPAGCLEQAQVEYDIPFNYVFLVKQSETSSENSTLFFERELLEDPHFILLFENNAGAVFAWQPKQ
jgi:hypothetical protein